MLRSGAPAQQHRAKPDACHAASCDRNTPPLTVAAGSSLTASQTWVFGAACKSSGAPAAAHFRRDPTRLQRIRQHPRPAARHRERKQRVVQLRVRIRGRTSATDAAPTPDRRDSRRRCDAGPNSDRRAASACRSARVNIYGASVLTANTCGKPSTRRHPARLLKADRRIVDHRVEAAEPIDLLRQARWSPRYSTDRRRVQPAREAPPSAHRQRARHCAHAKQPHALRRRADERPFGLVHRQNR